MASPAQVNLTTVKRGDTYVVNFFFTDTNGSTDISHVSIDAHAKRAIDGEMWFDLKPVKVDAAAGHFRIHLTREQTRQITESPPGSFSGIYDIQFSWPGAEEIFVATIVEGSISISKDITIVGENGSDLEFGGDGSIPAGSLDIELSGSLNPGEFAYDDKMTVEQITQNRFALGGAVGLGGIDWAVQAAISAAYAKQYKDETKVFRDETKGFRDQANQHRAVALQAAASSQASAETAAEITGLDTVDEAVKRLVDLRESLLKKATLRMNFDKNEYFVYEEPFGMQPKEITQVLTTERATAGTYQSPFGLRVVESNFPRLEYLKGLLAEKPSTNVAIDKPSGGLASTLNASGSSQVSDSDVIKPSGHEGDVVLITGASSLANIVRTPFYPLPDPTSDSTASVYARSAQGQAQFKLRLAGSSGVNSQNFSVGEKWERFDVSLAGVNQTLIGRSVGILDATAPLHVCSIQIEVGSQVTSYIPTTTASAIRDQDIHSLTLGESNFNQDEGTLYWEGELTTQTGGDILLGTNSRTSGQVFGIYRQDENLRVSFNDVFGPPNRLVLPIVETKVKVAVSYDRITKEYSACVNGGDVLSDVATNIPLPTMLVTKCGWGGLAPSLLHVNGIRYFPVKLTSEEMKELTK